MTIHDIGDTEDRNGNVENSHSVDINWPHNHWISLQQVADSPHSNGPIEQPAADEHTAASKNLLLYQAHFDEALALIHLVVISLG